MQRGFTLVESVIVAGIMALLLAGAALTLGARPMAMRTASMQFAAQLQAARALAASSGNGATIAVQPDGGGFKSILYAGRPNVPPLTPTSTPAVSSGALITEAGAGAPPFALFFSSSGTVSVQNRYPAPSQFDSPDVPKIAAEPACPPAGHYTVTIAANGASDAVDLPCTLPIAGTPTP